MSKRSDRLQQGRPVARQLRDEATTAAIYDRDPAKQYVREVGWLQVISEYLNRFRAAQTGRVWKYLTLPGKHAADVGLLWRAGLLEKSDDGKFNVAICDMKNAASVSAKIAPRGTLLAVSARPLDEELRLPGSSLANEFPFDVINLDWCDSLMPVIRPDANLLTIEWIFRLQRRQSFLLLLTTRPAHHSQNSLRPFLSDNLRDEPEFRQAYITRYGNERLASCLANYTEFTQIVVPKAIAEWARYWGYRTHEHFVGRYKRPARRQYPSYEMICHSFEFERLGTSGDRRKYEPAFQKVSRDSIRDRLYARLPTSVRNEAAQTYLRFIIHLLSRQSNDITTFLRSDSVRMAELTASAEALIGWSQT
jgi:hypothetical protein